MTMTVNLKHLYLYLRYILLLYNTVLTIVNDKLLLQK